jgi:hypothetical protein
MRVGGRNLPQPFRISASDEEVDRLPELVLDAPSLLTKPRRRLSCPDKQGRYDNIGIQGPLHLMPIGKGTRSEGCSDGAGPHPPVRSVPRKLSTYF